MQACDQLVRRVRSAIDALRVPPAVGADADPVGALVVDAPSVEPSSTAALPPSAASDDFPAARFGSLMLVEADECEHDEPKLTVARRKKKDPISDSQG